jgi:uncharacterized lipoprotein YehR (DUF1307 family)
MKKTGIMLIALLMLGVVLTGCGALNPVKNTEWEFSEKVAGFETRLLLSFKDSTVTFEVTSSVTILGATGSESGKFEGTYEYKNGEITGAFTVAGENLPFTATIEDDILTLKIQGKKPLNFKKVKK